MKKLTKSIITSILCAVIAITGIVASNTTTAYAASDDKVPVKVTYKGETVTLVKDINTMQARPKLKTLKKKWGKPKEHEERYDNPGNTTLKTDDQYKWTKGSSTISYNIKLNDESIFGSDRTCIYVNSSDKNIKINGLKVGMSQKKARKILKSLGLKKADYDDSYEMLNFKTGWISCGYEDGKVSSISVMIDYLEDFE